VVGLWVFQAYKSLKNYVCLELTKTGQASCREPAKLIVA
jgi:hypothetical protein